MQAWISTSQWQRGWITTLHFRYWPFPLTLPCWLADFWNMLRFVASWMLVVACVRQRTCPHAHMPTCPHVFVHAGKFCALVDVYVYACGSICALHARLCASRDIGTRIFPLMCSLLCLQPCAHLGSRAGTLLGHNVSVLSCLVHTYRVRPGLARGILTMHTCMHMHTPHSSFFLPCGTSMLKYLRLQCVSKHDLSWSNAASGMMRIRAMMPPPRATHATEIRAHTRTQSYAIHDLRSGEGASQMLKLSIANVTRLRKRDPPAQT
jgi:hypothetical protein